jgi:type I restriction enzyme R subunit
MKEYQRFSPDSVNGSESTRGLKRNIEKDDNKIIVTTIQKLNNLMKSEDDLSVYQKQVVFIFDEAHRSQFGEAQKNLKKKFKKYYQFGFTGTPIFPQNALGSETTASVFGRELHSYVITDAIRDEEVLKFKVDYNDVRPRFKSIETEIDENKLSAAENKKALLHPDRIKEVAQYILDNYRRKTHRAQGGNSGFNAMFAVNSVDAAKCYYEELNRLQKDSEKPLKIATIFSFAANEEQSAIGEILDESFEPTAMDTSAKEFLTKAINDYNAMFKASYGVDSTAFQNYYRDLAKRVKNREVDLLIEPDFNRYKGRTTVQLTIVDARESN